MNSVEMMEKAKAMSLGELVEIIEEEISFSADNLNDVVRTNKELTNMALELNRGSIMSAKMGDSVSMHWFGLWYLQGQNVPKDPLKALAWFYQAAQGSDVASQIILSNMFQDSNLFQHESWFPCWDGGEEVYPHTWTFLGDIYFYGIYGNKDHEKAYGFFLKGHQAGDPNSTHELASALMTGSGVEKDSVKAFKLYQSVADNNPYVQMKMGLCYLSGEGVQQDKTKAHNWFKIAAKNGVQDAQLNLGLMYLFGDGIKQNFNKAIKWLSKGGKNLEDEEATTKAQHFLDKALKAKNGEANIENVGVS